VIGCLSATVAYGIFLLAAFDPSVQQDGAAELVDRSETAREFLVADLFFPLFYGLLSPLAIWRFGAGADGGPPPGWIAAAAILLGIAAICDLAENVLLLTALDSVSAGAVDAAHLVALPKLACFGAGALLGIAILGKAARSLRAPAV
jgi:hypothetical protein